VTPIDDAATASWPARNTRIIAAADKGGQIADRHRKNDHWAAGARRVLCQDIGGR
jgi:hypothetical protein